ncbi:MAG: TetR/AcrR family transcriptional regulator [Candidatus Cohnella colombiensis]|uniref:TetR/AcrR family transcriptional regulator n=1 Tax=Candidatus Cohnella colombiensis TaxID=3121368 RepID=A0AA95EXT6_9BACL|nr:MAG: TetR/AcrR family transcriptional regulator [Cohnella sp.]
MQGKKRKILDIAMRCFARKGYHATSIQEIADELGMAKGSIYFYFKSKEDLLTSVLEYYVELLQERMQEFPSDRSLTPREVLSTQLEQQFIFFRENMDFVAMLMNEPVTGLQPDIEQLLRRFRARASIWNVKHLLAIYGHTIEEHTGDLSVLLTGMSTQFTQSVLIDRIQLDERRLSRYIVNRLDDLVTGILKRQEEPLLPSADLQTLYNVAGLKRDDFDREIHDLEKLIERVSESEKEEMWTEKQRSDVIAALTTLLVEIHRSQPSRIVSLGMLAYLREQGPVEWQELLIRVEQKLYPEKL